MSYGTIAELEQANRWQELNGHSWRVPDVLDDEVERKHGIAFGVECQRFPKFYLAREPWAERQEGCIGGRFGGFSRSLGALGILLHMPQLAPEHAQLAEDNSRRSAGDNEKPESEFRKAVCIDSKLACVFDKLPIAVQLFIGMGVLLLACLTYGIAYGPFERGRIKSGCALVLLGLSL